MLNIFVIENNETKIIFKFQFLNLQLWQPASNNKKAKKAKPFQNNFMITVNRRA